MEQPQVVDKGAVALSAAAPLKFVDKFHTLVRDSDCTGFPVVWETS